MGLDREGRQRILVRASREVPWHTGDKGGAYRGNHVHPVDQYTLLLKGKASNIIYVDGERVEIPLKFGEVAVVKAGLPHILVPEEDIFTFEWWDGDFIADECEGIFDDLTRDRVGPLD